MYKEVISPLCIFLCCVVYTVTGTCTWPSQFVSSTWIDSQKGDLIFGTTNMTGFKLQINAQTQRDAWECYNQTGQFLIMRTIQNFVLFVTNDYTGFRCLQLKKVTDYSYRYYEIDPTQASMNYIRVTVQDTSAPLNPAILCDTHVGASGSEFHVMIKKGYESAATLTCPYTLLSNYKFFYSASNPAVSCSPSKEGQMTMCTNVSQIGMTTACSATPLYSTALNLWCVDIVTTVTGIFVSLFNGEQSAGTIDSSTTYQFTCLAMDTAGTSMSVTPKNCQANQDPTDIPTYNSGADATGAVLSLSYDGSKCPPCPVLVDPLRGSVTVETDGAVTTATYACEGSYTLSGSETRVCQTNGTWSGTEPSCTCPIPNAPTNGSVSLSSDGLKAVFTCDTWFVLKGTANLTCDSVNNKWLGTDPTCAKCQSLTAPSNGSYNVTSNGINPVATYSCVLGTTLNGVSTRTCLTNQDWTSSTPKCTSCPERSNISSGYVNVTTDSTTTKAVYTCAAGYSLVGYQISTCQTTGSWDTVPPTCVCDPPSSPANGTVTVSIDATTAVYTCSVSYTLNGVRTRTCQTDGSGWTDSDPTCVYCPNLIKPFNGTVALSTNGTQTTATYTCDVGYSMSGAVTSQCSSAGTWSTQAPTCSRCDDLPTVSSGNFKLETDGSTTSAQYACDVGTTISGDVIISCGANGHWTTSTSSTTCVQCPDLSTVTGGQYTVSSNGTTSTAELTCSSGYTVTAGAALQCQSDGSWTQSQAQCISTSGSDEGTSGGLLAAVVVLAILAALLGIGFAGAMIYIRKMKSSVTESGQSKNHGLPEYAFPGSTAPVDHKQHVMDARHTSLSMAAPASHSTTPASSRMDMHSVTPRSSRTMKSAVSAGSLELDLVRENTTSSVFFSPDNPAPWSKKPSKDADRFEPNGTTGMSKFKPISSGPVDTTSPREGKSPRKKKESTSKKVLRQESVETLGRRSKTVLTSFRSTASPKPKLKERTDVDKNGIKEDFVEANGTFKVPRLDLSAKPERATTPVNHRLEVRDTEMFKTTPRSNVMATVQ